VLSVLNGTAEAMPFPKPFVRPVLIPTESSAASIGKWLRYYLIFVLVNHIADTFRLQHPHRDTVILQDCHVSPHMPKMRVGVVPKPANCPVLLAIVGRLRGGKPGWPFQIYVEPIAKLVKLVFLVRREPAFVPQFADRVKHSQMALRIFVDVGNYES
jgi:hypothetical protein